MTNRPIDLIFIVNPQNGTTIPKTPASTHRTTVLNLPVETLSLLRRVAFERSIRSAGRASVSALLLELVDRHKKELEQEISKATLRSAVSDR